MHVVRRLRMTTRRGRPPKVATVTPGEYEVVVGGSQYKFRQGSDGKLRALGTTDRNTEEFQYAKQRVTMTIQQQSSEATQ
jgi:hypothetical protein